MTIRFLVVVLAVFLLFSACGSKKEVNTWKPGDSVICPYSGREFPLPEKMGQ